MSAKMKVTAKELAEMTEETRLQKVLDFLSGGVVASAKCGRCIHGVFIISRDADDGVFTAKSLPNYSVRLKDVVDSLGDAGFASEIKDYHLSSDRGLKSFIIRLGDNVNG